MGCGCHLNHTSKGEHDTFWRNYYGKRKAAITRKDKKKKGGRGYMPPPRVAASSRKRKRGLGEFVGTYHEYMQSKQWAKKRQQARRHYGGKCTVCTSTENLNVHHRHYRTLFREAMADLDLLCNGCHRNHHERDGKACDPMTREFLSLASSF